MKKDEVDMYTDNCVAFQWEYAFDNTRRIGALTTFGRYEPYDVYHVKMDLNDLPSNFLRDYELDRFIYYPETKEKEEYVKEDRYFDSYLEEKQRLREEENKKDEDVEDENLEVSDTVSREEHEKLQKEFEELKRQMDELLKAMNGGN